MFGDSACAGHGGDGGFCHLVPSRDACPDLYPHSLCKRAGRWATDSGTAGAPRGEHHLPYRTCRSPVDDDLPDECLSEIFRRLAGNDDRGAASCVSKRWLSVLTCVRSCDDKVVVDEEGCCMQCGDAAAEAAVTRCLAGNEATDLRLAAVAARANGFGGLGKLLILGQPGNAAWKLTDAGLAVVAAASPSLTTLSVSHAPLVTDRGLREVANGCPNLVKLHLSRCPMVTDDGLIAVASNCPNLSSFTVEHCPDVGDRGLQAIGTCCCRTLHTASVIGCASVGDRGIAWLVCSASSTLAKLKLQNLNITDACLAVVGLYGRSLTDLSLVALGGVNERGFWTMANARGLENLRSAVINACPGATDVAVEALAKGCPSLRKLCLRRCCRLSNAGLTALAATAKVLGDLQIDQCNRVSAVGVLGALWAAAHAPGLLKSLSLVKCMGIQDKDAGVAPSSVSVPTPHSYSSLCVPSSNLRSLTVRDCPGFGDACLTQIRKLCPSLQTVELTGQPLAVTDAGILINLVDNSNNYNNVSRVVAAGLVNVDLTGCAQVVTDNLVSALANAHGPTLKLLNLGGCANLSDDGLLDILASCHVLEDLDLSRTSVTDAGVAALASAHLRLRVLSLSGCCMVTDDCLPFVKHLGNSLTGLNLINCNNVGEPAARLLQQEMDWCDIVF